MEVRSIPLERVLRPSTARTLDKATVAALATSIAEIGLIQPIVVVERGVPVRGIVEPGFLLIAGGHRLEAMKSLGREFIDARVVTGEALETELIEIDENLCRAELSASQRVAHVARRKQIWEALHPAPAAVPAWEMEGGCSVSNGEAHQHQTTFETGNGDSANSGATRASIPARGRGRPQEFAASTAAITGDSKSTINRQLAVANVLGDDLQKVEGTSLDKQVELQALAKLPDSERADLIERAAAGEQVSARVSQKSDTSPQHLRVCAAISAAVEGVLSAAGAPSIDAFGEFVRALPDQERKQVVSSLMSFWLMGELFKTAEAAGK